MKGKNASYGRPRRKGAVWLIMPPIIALLILPMMTTPVVAAPGDILLCSSDSSGTLGNAPSVFPVINAADGRYVAFTSTATNLVTPATTLTHIFRKDLVTNQTVLVSRDAANNPGNGVSGEPCISADGRYVAFWSDSTNLVTPATTGSQVFRKDLVTGEVRLVSANAAGVQGGAASSTPAISSDGRYVSFLSNSTNLVTPATTGSQVFRKDLVTGEVRLVSCNAAGVQSNGNAAYSTAISNDGRHVIFTSDGTNLMATPTAGQELFRKDLATGEVKLVSSDASWAESNLNNGYPSCSSDARYVSFASNATNLIPGVTHTQIYRKDLHTGAIALASANSAGVQGGGDSLYSSISADGRFVAFDSLSTNLVTPATAGRQIFRKDMTTSAVDLASANAAGAQGTGNSTYAAISADARYVAFWSSATNLITGVTGQQVYRKELAAPYHFYFAEGYTGNNFQEWLCLGNASANPINVAVTYLFKDGTTTNATYTVPANSRHTVDVNAVVGPNKDVSMHCTSDSPFIAERPMYFNYGGEWSGGHDAVGATAPSLTWYFAEGYTGNGFDEWVCVLNPGDVPANLTFRFQTQEAGERVVTGRTVGAHTRETFMANELLDWGSYQTSLKLEADQPIVAERPMYFNYTGTANRNWTGGSCVVGVPLLRSSYYFAEGTTRGGFDEWLTLQNPTANPITVHAVYNLASGGPVEKDYVVQPNSRSTVMVNRADEGVGEEQDVSVLLTCPTPFLAERPMYFAYPGLKNWGWTGGHCVIGAAAPATEWFFAEGYTAQNFEEWLCIQNPGAAAVVTITYYPEGGGAPIVKNHNVGANSRFTASANDDIAAALPISAKLTSTVPVIVERPMYFLYNGVWTGGHDVVGYTP